MVTVVTYEDTPIFISVDITEESVESVAQELWGALSQKARTLSSYSDGF